jgi:hypothetical protein
MDCQGDSLFVDREPMSPNQDDDAASLTTASSSKRTGNTTRMTPYNINLHECIGTAGLEMVREHENAVD